MIERTEQRFDIKPERLAGDTAYGSGANLNWLVNEAKMRRTSRWSISRSARMGPSVAWTSHSTRSEMLFAHLKRIFRLGRLRLRGPCGAQFEFTLAAIAQNLRRLAKLVVRPPPAAKACFA